MATHVNYKEISRKIDRNQIKKLRRRELEDLFLGEQDLRFQFEEKIISLQEELLLIGDKYVKIKTKVFNSSSEKRSSDSDENQGKGKKKKRGKPKPREDFSKSLTERYPDATVKEEEIYLETPPECKCCGKQLKESGMFEESEYLDVIPKQHIIVRQKRAKYNCSGCHGDIQTAPGKPRIVPSGSCSDNMLIDVVISKFDDLIPIERYTKMAGREGLNLPANTMHKNIQFFAEFVEPAALRVRDDVLASQVNYADESLLRMLEGMSRNWRLWSFANERSCYFEAKPTRAGSHAIDFLINSICEFLMTDIFSGYKKTLKEVNEYRGKHQLPLMKSVYCNVHARRKFIESEVAFPKASHFYIEMYKAIYVLESQKQVTKNVDEQLKIRQEMTQYFLKMKTQGEIDLLEVSSQSSLAKAINYFIKHYAEFTSCTDNPIIPLDNNLIESRFRNPAVGRKIWYGVHSENGAKATAILFTLTESCKMNKVNSRAYFQALVTALHNGDPPFTPFEYSQKEKQ